MTQRRRSGDSAGVTRPSARRCSPRGMRQGRRRLCGMRAAWEGVGARCEAGCACQFAWLTVACSVSAQCHPPLLSLSESLSSNTSSRTTHPPRSAWPASLPRHTTGAGPPPRTSAPPSPSTPSADAGPTLTSPRPPTPRCCPPTRPRPSTTATPLSWPSAPCSPPPPSPPLPSCLFAQLLLALSLTLSNVLLYLLSPAPASRPAHAPHVPHDPHPRPLKPTYSPLARW